jgi:hypothetical protein
MVPKMRHDVMLYVYYLVINVLAEQQYRPIS